MTPGNNNLFPLPINQGTWSMAKSLELDLGLITSDPTDAGTNPQTPAFSGNHTPTSKSDVLAPAILDQVFADLV